MPDERFMRAAIKLAGKGLGKTSPNPAVGAVIVKDGRIIAKGYHKKAGLPHAEIEALRSAPEGSAKGATLYVTLEPCCHFGRTPPCTDAIINSGIKRVVIGMKDPNPLVSGKGIGILKRKGIEVASGILEADCINLNRPYIKYIQTKLPFVTLKLASTLDGKIATSTGESKWITGEAARRHVHKMRSAVDAIMAGSGTIIKDDPELTVRLAKGKNPRRVILDSSFSVPLTSKVFKGEAPIVFTTKAASAEKIEKACGLGAEVIILPKIKDGVDIKKALQELGKREITSVLVEGGGRLAASLLKNGMADKLALFLAPMLIGAEGLPSIGGLGVKALNKAIRLKSISSKMIGSDILIEGLIN